jgi:hypothetical protein
MAGIELRRPHAAQLFLVASVTNRAPDLLPVRLDGAHLIEGFEPLLVLSSNGMTNMAPLQGASKR